MQKKYIVRLSKGEREELLDVVQRLKGSSQKVRRAQVLLKADVRGPNWTDARIAETFSCRVQTVENLRRRLVIPPEADAEFIAAMEEVLDTYEAPYDADYPVLDIDEQPVQLHKETRRTIPATKNHARRVDYEYERCGTACVFMFTEPLSGWREATVRPQRP